VSHQHHRADPRPVLLGDPAGFTSRVVVPGEVGHHLSHDPRREACWIAEKDGARVGTVMLVQHPERPGVARLRLLLVEPSARGLGVGGALVETCTRFARAAGYGTVTLWTQSVLAAARAIYAREGYVKVSEAPNTGFGEGLVAETWELAL